MSTIARNKSAQGLALLLGVVAIAGIARTAPQAVGPSGYHLVTTVKLGGTGGWDYLTVDPATHRLFISRGTHFMVVDLAQAKSSGIFPIHRARTASLSLPNSIAVIPPTAARQTPPSLIWRRSKSSATSKRTRTRMA